MTYLFASAVGSSSYSSANHKLYSSCIESSQCKTTHNAHFEVAPYPRSSIAPSVESEA